MKLLAGLYMVRIRCIEDPHLMMDDDIYFSTAYREHRGGCILAHPMRLKMFYVSGLLTLSCELEFALKALILGPLIPISEL